MLDRKRCEAVYFVVKAGGVRSAAEAMNVDPAAVSRHIARAAADVGLPLFERRGRILTPTPAATAIAAHFEDQQQGAASLAARIAAMRGAQAGLVRLGVGEGYVGELVTGPVGEFMRAHPGIRVRMETLSVDEIISRLEEGRLDIGLAFNPTPAPQLKLWARRRVPVKLVAAPHHPLLQRRAKLTLADIAPYTIGLMTVGYGLRKLVQRAEYVEGIRLEPSFETSSLTALNTYVFTHCGVSILSEKGVENESRAGLVGCADMALDLFEASEVHLFSAANIRLMPAVDALLRIMSVHFSKPQS